MRKPETIEKLYLDFDGFFASVMQQAMPALRGRPVGVIPFPTDRPDFTILIACSREAKAAGVKNIMPVPEALALCPDMVLVPQRPDLYRRAQAALLNEISCEIPIETVKSIDELTCALDPRTIADPVGLVQRIKRRIHTFTPHITCSIGFAANRLLAKMACKAGKPNGLAIWHPEAMPGPLLMLKGISEVPGIGPSMTERLTAAGLGNMVHLWNCQPKRLRAVWGNVSGERMWYALHGYDLHAQPTGRGMFGHSRVLPPDCRALDEAHACSRLLLTKAARRMRRDGFRAGRLDMHLAIFGSGWAGYQLLHDVLDDLAVLKALEALWAQAKATLLPRTRIISVGVTLGALTTGGQRQGDFLRADDHQRRRAEMLTNLVDGLNQKFGQRMLTFGHWKAPPGGFAGGKIAYNRIPSAEDFW